MKISKALRGFVEQARASDSYWVEEAKLKFALALDGRRKAAGMTYKAVAEKLGTSAAYITKIFRGDTNMTIETMVKLARATGGNLDLRIVDVAQSATSWDIATLEKVSPSQTTAASATIYAFPGLAANHYKFEDAAAA